MKLKILERQQGFAGESMDEFEDRINDYIDCLTVDGMQITEDGMRAYIYYHEETQGDSDGEDKKES